MQLVFGDMEFDRRQFEPLLAQRFRVVSGQRGAAAATLRGTTGDRLVHFFRWHQRLLMPLVSRLTTSLATRWRLRRRGFDGRLLPIRCGRRRTLSLLQLGAQLFILGPERCDLGVQTFVFVVQAGVLRLLLRQLPLQLVEPPLQLLHQRLHGCLRNGWHSVPHILGKRRLLPHGHSSTISSRFRQFQAVNGYEANQDFQRRYHG